jgi:hypothetical protein
MNLRRFNQQGVDQFAAYLAVLRQDRATPPPPELIDDPRFTELVDPAIEIDNRELASKYIAGEYLHNTLAPIPVSRLRSDVELWSWLALWFFDQLCPPDGHGRRKPLENNKYISFAGDHRYGSDKHLLYFPWKMYSLHGQSTSFFLADELGKDTRAQREWTGYYLNVSTALVELGGRLYGDKNTGSLKRGATGKRGGSLRRFVQVLHQLEVTYAIHGMSVDQIQATLPSSEFGRWITWHLTVGRS